MRISIEGIKLSGKSSIVQLLNQLNRETSIFEFRSHCTLNAPKYTLSPDIGKMLEKYAAFLYELRNADYLLLRGHIFPFALAKCTGQKMSVDFRDIDSLFKQNKSISVLLTVNETNFKERLESRIKNGRKVQEWDASWDKMQELQSSYEFYFQQSSIPSIKIDTSLIGAEDVVNKIIEFQNSKS